jgi:hypothetical protein
VGLAVVNGPDVPGLALVGAGDLDHELLADGAKYSLDVSSVLRALRRGGGELDPKFRAGAQQPCIDENPARAAAPLLGARCPTLSRCDMFGTAHIVSYCGAKELIHGAACCGIQYRRR